MSIVIHGMPASVCTRRVMAVLEELEVPYKIKVVDVLSGMNNTPEHLARQPFGKIPIIVMDDDLVLYESRAISKYLCTKYSENASKLTVDPTDARDFAIYEQLLSVEVTTFDPAAKDLFEESLSTKQKLHATELSLERSWTYMNPAYLRHQNISLETNSHWLTYFTYLGASYSLQLAKAI
ncbi:thioredoxin-like protein [Trichoderma sp. SZMC 28015]